MKKINILIFLASASFFIFSCGGNFFNPKYYYGKSNNGLYAEEEAPPPPPEYVDAASDPFKVGEWNNINYGGYDGSKFDSEWMFKASFDAGKGNLPIYMFSTLSKKWFPGGVDWKGKQAYYYIPETGLNKVYNVTILGTINIDPLKIYKYNGDNPLYAKSGYLEGRMDRFRFYSIDGKASIELKQYLIAVDTYSKFVFAYGKITATGELLGNIYPKDFRAIEYYAKRIPFYEYDPIGYVDKSGEVVLYDDYTSEFPKDPTGYEPKQHGYEEMASHSKNGQGRSPYLSKHNNDKYKITITVKELKNISVRSRTKVFGIPGKPGDYAGFTYSIAGTAYDSSIPIEDLDIIENKDPRSESTTGIIYWSEVLELYIGKTKDFSSSKEYEITVGKEMNIDLGSRVDKYNWETLFADTAKFGENGSGNMAEKNSPKLRLKYNDAEKCFKPDSGESIISNSNTLCSITYDNNFTLKEGEEKDITIKYNWKKGNDTSNGEEFEITYKLKFEKAE